MPTRPARKVVTGRKVSSITGFVPVAKGGGLVAFESLDEERLLVQMRDDVTVARLAGQPETFLWRDAETGEARRYTPDFLAEFTDGTRAYREVKPSAELLENPSFGGRRDRIEEECRSRGARFEVWTEREIRGEDPFIRVASETERSLLALAGPRELVPPDNGLPHAAAAVARELAIERGMNQGAFWIGRSALTGLVTAVRPKPLPVPRWARSIR